MNGNSRLGILYAIFGGSMVSQGIEGLSENVVAGGILTLLGLFLSIASFSQIDKGVKESIRIHDLEKAAKKVR